MQRGRAGAHTHTRAHTRARARERLSSTRASVLGKHARTVISMPGATPSVAQVVTWLREWSTGEALPFWPQLLPSFLVLPRKLLSKGSPNARERNVMRSVLPGVGGSAMVVGRMNRRGRLEGVTLALNKAARPRGERAAEPGGVRGMPVESWGEVGPRIMGMRRRRHAMDAHRVQERLIREAGIQTSVRVHRMGKAARHATKICCTCGIQRSVHESSQASMRGRQSEEGQHFTRP